MDDEKTGLTRSNSSVPDVDGANSDRDVTQFGLTFGAETSAIRLEKPDRKSRAYRRDGLRADARRTVEYIASRGKTPIEALHDIVKPGWRAATRAIAKDLGISRLEAFRLWQRCAEELLPYTAPRLDGLDVAALAGAVAGGVGLSHFLAASRASAEMEARRTVDGSTVDVTPRPDASQVLHTLDATESGGIASEPDSGTVSPDDLLSRLPPRGSD